MSDADKVTDSKRRVGDGTPGPGRPKGSTNKATKQLKDMILGALNQAGGEQYLLECARDPKLAGPFLTLIGKVLPQTIQGAGENGEIVFAKIVREVVDPKA